VYYIVSDAMVLSTFIFTLFLIFLAKVILNLIKYIGWKESFFNSIPFSKKKLMSLGGIRQPLGVLDVCTKVMDYRIGWLPYDLRTSLSQATQCGKWALDLLKTSCTRRAAYSRRR
jgi:hypothetical protein